MHYCNDVWKCKPVSVKIVSVFLRLQHYFHAIPDSEGVFRFIKSYGESSPLPQLTIRKSSFNLKCQQLFEELDVTAFCDNIIPSLPITSIFVLIDQLSKQVYVVFLRNVSNQAVNTKYMLGCPKIHTFLKSSPARSFSQPF